MHDVMNIMVDLFSCIVNFEISSLHCMTNTLNATELVVNVLYYDDFYDKGGVTQTEICQRTFQSKQTVNLIIRNLSKEGYVTVERRKENKREKLVRITEEGKKYCEKVVRHISWAENTAISMFSQEEQNS